MPTHATNGHAGPGAATGDELAVAAQRAPDASERATSTVLALDGWGRLEPEPHINGAAPAPTQAEPAAAELAAEPPPTPLTKQNFERHLEPLPNNPPWRNQSAKADAPPSEQVGEPAGAQVLRLGRLEIEAGPGMRLFASALVFGLAAGALVGAALRWLELRNTPPPPPPPPNDLLSRIHRAWDAFSMPDPDTRFDNRARHRRQSR